MSEQPAPQPAQAATRETLPVDRVVRSAHREARWALLLWLAAMIYTITYCVERGYGRAAESLTFVLWFPDWVFWGILVPWLVCAAISIYFALWVIEDDPLISVDDAPAEASAAQQPRKDAPAREAGDV